MPHHPGAGHHPDGREPGPDHDQPTLFDVVGPGQPPTTAEQFERYHRANPRVFEELDRLATEWVDRTGGRKIGIGALTERVRWEIAISTDDPDFKINNNFRPYYARLLMSQNPKLAGLFNLRQSAADEWSEAA